MKLIKEKISVVGLDNINSYYDRDLKNKRLENVLKIADNEKKLWKNEKTTDEWKLENLEKIKSRMKGWQLNTFEESYDHKVKKGISLFKKNLLKNNL